MASLLNLTPSERKNLFLDTIKKLAISALEYDDERLTYKIDGCEGQGQFYFNVNLKDLIFVASNEYELWLSVYNYFEDNSNKTCKTKVVYYDVKNNSQKVKIVEEDEYESDFHMLDDDTMRDIIEELMDSDTDDSVTIEDIVDAYVEELMIGENFRVRRVRDTGYLTDEEDEEDEDYEDNSE